MIVQIGLGLPDFGLNGLATRVICRNSTVLPKTTCFAYPAILHPLPMP
jgi:hypothetical protein